MRILSQVTNRAKAAMSVLLRGTGTNQTITGMGMAQAGLLSWLGSQFSVSYERTQTHKDMDRMDKDDEIVPFALNTIASRATGIEDPSLDAFTVLVQAEDATVGEVASEAEVTRAQGEVNSLTRRLDLRQLTWHIIRNFVKWGNEFREVLIDWETQTIVGLKLLPEHTVWPNMDERGNRLPGFTQRPESMPAGTSEVRFSEFDMIHWTFGAIDGYLGTPLLACGRRNWKRLNAAEDATALARLVRAFVKMIHKVPVNADWPPEAQQKAIDRYKAAMTKRPVFDQDLTALEKEPFPTTVLTDFFLPDDGSKRGGVEAIDPENAQLQNIGDIEHFMNRLICATTIPKRYFPFEGAVPKLSEGGGQAEDKNFACTLMFCQMVLKAGLTELFDRQLILRGINPRRLRYVIRMADINTTDSFRAAQTQLNLAKVMDILVSRFPDLGEHLDILFREYLRVSDASLATLGKVKAEPNMDAGGPGGNGNRKARTQLPGHGLGDEARTQI